MPHPRFSWMILAVLMGLTIGTAVAVAGDQPGGEASLEVSAVSGATPWAGNRPNHGPFNLHLAVGASFGLGDTLAEHDPPYKDSGGEGTLGLDIVMIEPLALSVLGGFNGFGIADKDGLRSIFVGAGLRLRLFVDRNGALFDDGTAAGNLWIDAHFAYYNYNYEDHGGYNIGLGYELALWKDVNLGPYVRLHHTPLGDGLNFAMLSVGLAVSFAGRAAPEDRDGDGIPDHEDECPDEPGPPETKGCPPTDRDGDGIPDHLDECPDVPGPGTEDGCPNPDSDGDGFCDPWVSEHGYLERYADICTGVDLCPDEPGPGTEDGCPRMVRVVGDQIKILQKVFFATNKAVILEESFPVLDEVAQVILYRRDIRVRVEGHTDSRGNRKRNLKLSQARAEAVKAYLVEKGVEEERLVSEGKGPDVPIADNKTEEGRGENRRVEFHILPSADEGEDPAGEE